MTREEIVDLDTLAQMLPKLDVTPVLDAELQDWAMEVADYVHNSPRYVRYSPRSATDLSTTVSDVPDKHPSTTYDGIEGRSRHGIASEKDRGKNAVASPQAGRSSGRIRFRSYRGEPLTLREQSAQKGRSRVV